MALPNFLYSPLTYGEYLEECNPTMPALEAKHFEKPEDWDSGESVAERRMIRELFVNRNKKSFKLRDFVEPKIKEFLPKNEKALMRHISKYRDKNIDILSDIYILKNMIFTDTDSNILFNATNVDKDELQTVIDGLEKPPFVQEQKNITPFRMLMLFVIRYYKLTKPNPQYYELCKNYYEYNLYYSLFSSNFRYGVEASKFSHAKETMIYTIDNLQNGMVLKKTGSVEGMMEALANRVFDPEKYNTDKAKYDYNSLWADGSDWGMEYIINQLKTRLNGQFTTIRKKYTDNYKEGKVTYTQNSITNEDGEIIENEFASGRIGQLADTYTTSFFMNNIDRQLALSVAKAFTVSGQEIIYALDNMRQSHNIEELRNFYSAVFTLFWDQYPNAKAQDIHSKMFITLCESVYKSGNSKNDNVLLIKKTTHEWLKRGSSTYRATTSSATINGFRRAIFYYFIIFTSKHV